MESLPSEMQARLEKCQERVSLLLHSQSNIFNDNGTPSPEVVDTVRILDESLWYLEEDEFSSENMNVYRSSLAGIVEHTDVWQILIDIVTRSLDKVAHRKSTISILSLFANLSAVSSTTTKKFAIDTRLLPLLIKTVENNFLDESDEEYKKNDLGVLRPVLYLLANVAIEASSIPTTQSCRIIDVVQHCLNLPDVTVNLMAIEILARVAETSGVEQPEIKSDTLESFINILTKAHRSVDGCHNGWEVWRVCQVLHLLSSSKANQIKIAGCLSPLVEILLTGHDVEKKEALLCLRNVSSDPSNQERMLSEPALALTIKFLYLSEENHKGVCYDILSRLKELNVTQGTGEGYDEDLEDLLSCTDSDQHLDVAGKDCKGIQDAVHSKSTKQTETKIRVVLRLFEKSCELLRKVKPTIEEEHSEHFTPLFIYCVLVISGSYSIFKPDRTPVDIIEQFQSSLSNLVLQNGTLQTLSDFISDHLKRCDLYGKGGNTRRQLWWPVPFCLGALVNYSDLSSDVRDAIAEHERLLPLLMKELGNYHEGDSSLAFQPYQMEMFDCMLLLVHNVSCSENLVAKLRDLNVVKVVQNYLDFPDTKCRVTSIFTLARVVNEDEANELLGTHSHLFAIIIGRLARALERKDHKDEEGWHVEEMTDALKFLARCDANKARLVEDGCLPIIATIFKSGWPGEQRGAISCLRHLSFEPRNKPHILLEPGLMLAVRDLYKNTEGDDKTACYGVLRAFKELIGTCKTIGSLEDEIFTSEETLSGPGRNETSSETSESSSQNIPKGYVMLSYEAKDEDMIKQICSELRGLEIPLWIGDDEDESTLDDRARAVENAAVVVIAMSQKYKDSADCRDEAEYARSLNKPIIPLLTQPGYRPDGWLGLLRGRKVTYDFTGESFGPSMAKLTKVVSRFIFGKRDDEKVTANTAGSSTGDVPHPGTGQDRNNSSGTVSTLGDSVYTSAKPNWQLIGEEECQESNAESSEAVPGARITYKYYMHKSYIEHVGIFTTGGVSTMDAREEEDHDYT